MNQENKDAKDASEKGEQGLQSLRKGDVIYSVEARNNGRPSLDWAVVSWTVDCFGQSQIRLKCEDSLLGKMTQRVKRDVWQRWYSEKFFVEKDAAQNDLNRRRSTEIIRDSAFSLYQDLDHTRMPTNVLVEIADDLASLLSKVETYKKQGS